MLRIHCDYCDEVIKNDERYYDIILKRGELEGRAMFSLCLCRACASKRNLDSIVCELKPVERKKY